MDSAVIFVADALQCSKRTINLNFSCRNGSDLIGWQIEPQPLGGLCISNDAECRCQHFAPNPVTTPRRLAKSQAGGRRPMDLNSTSVIGFNPMVGAEFFEHSDSESNEPFGFPPYYSQSSLLSANADALIAGGSDSDRKNSKK